jgi:hypothetical protein
MESKIEIAKRIIKDHFKEAECGIFDSRNIAGDSMDTIYYDGNLQIDICYNWEYFEVFGLSDEEFKELKRFYCYDLTEHQNDNLEPPKEEK